MDRLISTTQSVFADSRFADADFAKPSFANPGLLPSLLRMLGWGCSHDNYTLPMRLPGGTELTVSCLNCAARLRYDWERMALADGRSPSSSSGLQIRSQATRTGATVIHDRGPLSPNLHPGSGLREAA